MRRLVTRRAQRRPSWVVSALGACRSAEGLCGAPSIELRSRRRGVRRSGLGRTDGAADAEKQPTGLAGLPSAGQ